MTGANKFARSRPCRPRCPVRLTLLLERVQVKITLLLESNNHQAHTTAGKSTSENLENEKFATGPRVIIRHTLLLKRVQAMG